MCESASKGDIPFPATICFSQDFFKPQDQQNGKHIFLINILVPQNLNLSSHIPRNIIGSYLPSQYLLNFFSNLSNLIPP